MGEYERRRSAKAKADFAFNLTVALASIVLISIVGYFL